MRNVSVVAIVALVGVLGFSAQAQAQGHDLQDVAGWWSTLNCKYMIGAAFHSGADANAVFTAGTDGDSPSEQKWCKMNFSDLKLADRADLDTAVTTTTANEDGITRKPTDELISAKGWWDDLTFDGQDAAVGGLTSQTADGALQDKVAFTALTVAQNTRVMNAYSGLRGSGATTTQPTPALPLVGLGFLGLLLAGRGVYLRRRRA
jgi:hypothetical protein